MLFIKVIDTAESNNQGGYSPGDVTPILSFSRFIFFVDGFFLRFWGALRWAQYQSRMLPRIKRTTKPPTIPTTNEVGLVPPSSTTTVSVTVSASSAVIIATDKDS